MTFELQERVVFHYSGLLEANQWGGYISQNGQVLLILAQWMSSQNPCHRNLSSIFHFYGRFPSRLNFRRDWSHGRQGVPQHGLLHQVQRRRTHQAHHGPNGLLHQVQPKKAQPHHGPSLQAAVWPPKAWSPGCQNTQRRGMAGGSEKHQGKVV